MQRLPSLLRPRFEDPEDARALYLGDPHPHFRNAGSFVEWLPEFRVSRFDTPPGTPALGAFRGPGSGSTFLLDGTRVFGPSPRNLDEFPIEVVTEELPDADGTEVTYLMVDTTRLLCGENPIGGSPQTCELAPPFD